MHSTRQIERFWHEDSLGNFMISSVHPDFERKNVVLAIKKFQQVCQNFILPVQRIVISGKILYWKKDSFVNIFRHWAICSSLILKNFRRSRENWFSFGVAFLWNKYFLKNFDFLSFFGVLEKTFVVVISTCIRIFLGINFEEKCWPGKVLFFFLGHWAKTFRSDSNIFVPRKRRILSTYAEVLFWGTRFQKKV